MLRIFLNTTTVKTLYQVFDIFSIKFFTTSVAQKLLSLFFIRENEDQHRLKCHCRMRGYSEQFIIYSFSVICQVLYKGPHLMSPTLHAEICFQLNGMYLPFLIYIETLSDNYYQMILCCIMIILQPGEGVGGEKCHIVFTEAFSELLTFMAFITDHNSTFESFLCLE